jgi:hypothetical protein
MAVAAEENESRPRTGRYSWFIVSFSIIYEPGTASFFHQSTNQALLGKFEIKTIIYKTGKAQHPFFQKYQSGCHVKLKLNVLFFSNMYRLSS